MKHTLKHYLDTMSSELVRQDRKQAEAAAKRGGYSNPYALGLLLQAHERLTHAVSNAANLDSVDPGDGRMLAHQICAHFTNTPAARKVVKAIAKDAGLTWEAWAGYRDSIVFIQGTVRGV